jgi:Fe-S oxidoreductase
MIKSKRSSAFHEELCTRCGICFNKCPVLHLPIEEAKKEIIRLIEGKNSIYVLSKCNTCFSCNLYCPENANPYQLILERWNDLYHEQGAPPLYTFVCPTRQDNIWQLLNVFLSPTEKRWIVSWMNNKPQADDIVLLIGNYTHLFPFIIGGSKILDYFTPVDLIDQWEGGAYLYQGGYLDIVETIARKTRKDFEKWENKKIVAALDAVEYIYQEVHPKEMNIDHEKSFKSLQQWILKNIDSGSLSITNPLNMTTTVHDNCYSKVLGGKYWEVSRDILKKCGCKVKEMEHNKADSLCCGFGAGASWVRNISIPFDIIHEGMKKFKEAEETGAQALISYCGGCIYLLWATKELMGSKIDLYHIIEIVRMGIGEQLEYPKLHIKRAWDIISIITYVWLVSLFRNSFFIKRIAYDQKKSTFKPKNYYLLKFIRNAFNSSLIKKVFRKIFLFLTRILNTREKIIPL